MEKYIVPNINIKTQNMSYVFNSVTYYNIMCGLDKSYQ